jgi:NADP-dependent 3-hydroxy acid dehydrogenase YdfG
VSCESPRQKWRQSHIDPQHVAAAVVAMVQRPLGVSVPAITILATGMPYAGRG